MNVRAARTHRYLSVMLSMVMTLSFIPVTPVAAAGRAGAAKGATPAPRYAAVSKSSHGASAAQRATVGKQGSRLIVEWEPGVPTAQIDAASARLGFRIVAADPAIGADLVAPASKAIAPQALADSLKATGLARSARVENVYAPSAAKPNDPLFHTQYALENLGQTGGKPGADIKALRAWDRGTGSAGIVVAVVDTGVDIGHPDLSDNIWTNPGEVPNNGVDDDRNGYIDDARGWDFVNNDGTVYDQRDGDQHGTHVAGIIGAVGNNGVGISGVSQNVTIMPVKFLGPWGGSEYAGALALRYAVDNGADVINCSWGGWPSPIIGEALDYAAEHGVLVVCAAGNYGADLDRYPDWADFPAGYESTAVVSVAATDDEDKLAAFSNYGARLVDVAAPGVDVNATLPTETVGLYIDKMPSKIMYLAFAPEALVPAAAGKTVIQRSMSKLVAEKNIPVLLVDDSMPATTKEAPGVRRAFYTSALSAAGYADVTVWFTQTQGAPPANVMSGKTVVWFTGATTAGWDADPSLDTTERASIGTYLDGGGRLLMASGEIAADIGGWMDPQWFAKYFHAQLVGYDTWSYSFAGTGGGPLEGINAEVSSAYQYEQGGETRMWPTASDSVIATDKYATPVADMGGYGKLSGTSMASPHVAGIAALLMSQMPGTPAEQIRVRIENTAEQVPSLGTRVGYGGRTDADAAAGSYVGRPLSIEPTSGVGTLKSGRSVPVKWKMPTGASADAVYEMQQGLPYTAMSQGFESGMPVNFTTPAGAKPWQLTQAPSLVHSGGQSIRSAPLNPTGDVEILEQGSDPWGSWVSWTVTGVETSTVETKITVPEGGGTLSFWWSMEALDPLAVFMVDGMYVADLWWLPWPWQKVETELSAGEHTLSWTYIKYYGDFTHKADCVAVDDLTLTAHAFSTAGTAPAGSRTATWTAPLADTAEALLRLRAKTATRTSPWAYSEPLKVSSDALAPGMPQSFSAVPGDNGNATLRWTNPTAGDFDEVRVVRRVGTAPTGPEDASATVIYEGRAPSASDVGLVHGDRAHYAAYAYDLAGNVSDGARAQFTAVDTVAPGKPIAFDARMEDGVVGVSWLSAEPAASASVKVVRTTGRPATGIDDPKATAVYDGTARYAFDYQLSKTTTLTTAYYTAQIVDASGNRSTPATTSVAVDTRGPRGSITAAGGARSVFERTVSVKADVIRAVEMRYNSGSGWGEWMPFAARATVDLSATEGLRTIRGQFRDANGVLCELADDVYYNAGSPAAPIEVTATATLGKAKLKWSASTEPDLQGYFVYQASSASGPYRLIGQMPGQPWAPQPPVFVPSPDGWSGRLLPAEKPPVVEFLTPALTVGKTYYFKVTAVDKDELEGEYSAMATVRAGSVARRIAGKTAADTAVATSRAFFKQVKTVVMARSSKPADQAAAAGLAGSHGSPLLLASDKGISDATAAEIRRLGAAEVLVVGASGGLTSSIASKLGTQTVVSRVAGSDRYQTAAAVARAMASAEATPGRMAFLVNGDRPADALAVIPAAYAQRAPVLFTHRSKMPAVTSGAITDLDFERILVVGDTGIITEGSVSAAVPWIEADRLYGSSSAELAVTMADLAVESEVASYGITAIVNPKTYPEAAVGAVAAGARGGVAILTGVDKLPASSAQALNGQVMQIKRVEVYGGTKTLSSKGYKSLHSALRWEPEPWGMFEEETGLPPGARNQ